MKKLLFTGIGLSTLLFSGCQPADTAGDLSGESCFPVCFNLRLEKQILPFPIRETPPQASPVSGTTCQAVGRNMPETGMPDPVPPGSVPEEPDPGTPDDPKGLDELCNRIDYFVYEPAEGNRLVKHKICPLADADFGIIYDSLPAGHYRLVFLAHSSRPTAAEEGFLQFNRVTDTFYAAANTDIQAEGANRADIALSRIVSKIEFVSTEAAPGNLGQFAIRVERYPDRLDLLTAAGSAAEEPHTFTWDSSAEATGNRPDTYPFYTFIPPETETLDIELAATDTTGRLLRRREVKNIRPLANRIIRYSGSLYRPSFAEGSFNLEVTGEGQWGGTQEEALPE